MGPEGSNRGQGKNFLKMSSLPAKKLRLHAAPDLEATGNRVLERQVSSPLKTYLLILVIGITAGLVVKGFCLLMRDYQAEGRIAIAGVDGESVPSAMRKHLSGLLTSDLTFNPGDNPEAKISIQDLTRNGRLSIFPSDKQTISLLVTGPSRDGARKLAEDITCTYVAYVTGSQNARSSKMTGQREKLFASYKQLHQEHEKLKLQLTKLAEGLPQDKLDQILTSTSQRMQDRIKGAEELIGRLDKINGEIAAMREELVHPTLRLDPQRWDEVRKADRLYSGDFNVLKNKHTEYMSILQKDIRGLSGALELMRRLLGTLGESINKQVQMKLPEDLSDDLLELNLAVEKYEGQLAHFQDRWERYQAKIVELLSNPVDADFGGIGTLLSQLRQDLMNRCSRLPEHLTGLFNQVRQGSPGTGGLSSLTPRQVASSELSKDIEQIVDTWRTLTFHLNRLFADAKGNAHLVTLGRVCRSLQWRLSFREKQLRQILEQQMMASQRREVQNRLAQLQKDFEQTSAKLIAVYRQFAGDQQQLAEVSKRWPESQKLQETVRHVEQQMAGLEKEMDHTNNMVGPEQLEVKYPIVRAHSRLGIDPRWETMLSLAFVVMGMAVTTGIVRPEVVGRIFRWRSRMREDTA